MGCKYIIYERIYHSSLGILFRSLFIFSTRPLLTDTNKNRFQIYCRFPVNLSSLYSFIPWHPTIPLESASYF